MRHAAVCGDRSNTQHAAKRGCDNHAAAVTAATSGTQQATDAPAVMDLHNHAEASSSTRCYYRPADSSAPSRPPCPAGRICIRRPPPSRPTRRRCGAEPPTADGDDGADVGAADVRGGVGVADGAARAGTPQHLAGQGPPGDPTCGDGGARGGAADVRGGWCWRGRRRSSDQPTATL